MKNKTSTRIFHKRVITVTVISEDELSESLNLDTINEAITTGDCSGEVCWGPDIKITAKKAVKELQKQGSDAGFFQLNEDGSDLGDESGVELDKDGHCLGGTL